MNKRAVIPPRRVHEHVEKVFGDDLHARRVASHSDAAVGAPHARG